MGQKKINFLTFSRKNPDLFVLLYFRWVFLFYSEGTYTLVLPNGIKDVLRNFIDTPDFKEENKKRSLLRDYVEAFMNLYGTFETDFFLKMWNQHNKHYPLKVHELFRELINLAWLNEGLSITDDLEHIFDNFVMSESEVPLFMRKSIHHDYYRPTKVDVKYFAKHEFDERTTHYKKIKRFLSKKLNSKNLEKAMDMIMAHIKLDLGLQNMGQELDTQFGIIFDGSEDVEEFAELYKDLNNHSRKWAIRGQTPLESSKRNLNQTAIPEIGSSLMNSAPKQNQPIRLEKIGHNDPCPCGSGKKYKHCHGK